MIARGNWKRGVTLAALSLAAIGLVVVMARRPGPDFKVYAASGEAVLQGKDIYQAPLPLLNTGPPFFSIFCVGPALLERVSPAFGRGVWTAVNLAALLLILNMAGRLIHGRRLPITSASVLLPLLFTLPYILYHFFYHQVNLIVFALTLGGMTLQEERKDALGGVLVGAGSALKVMPILFVPYLAYRRRWRAALSALLATAAFTLCPALILGWDRFGVDFKHWWSILPHNPVWDAGQMNQSVLAMWDRILGHGIIPFVSPGTNVMEMSGAPIVQVAWKATVVVTGLLMLISFRGQPERGSIAVIVEWSAIFIVSAIFGPVGWKHYLVVLLLPNMLLYWMWRSHPDPGARRLAKTVFWGCFLTSLLSTRALWPASWCQRMGMASTMTLASLFMLGGLLWLRRRRTEGGAGAAHPGVEAVPANPPLA
jgi:hypothetical protein